jgi:hypothetical protein
MKRKRNKVHIDAGRGRTLCGRRHTYGSGALFPSIFGDTSAETIAILRKHSAHHTLVADEWDLCVLCRGRLWAYAASSAMRARGFDQILSCVERGVPIVPWTDEHTP